MRAGVLRRPVRLEASALVTQSNGASALVFSPAGEAFAEIRLLRQGESVAEGRLAATATHVIRLRRRDDVAPGWRMVSEHETYRVLAVTQEPSSRAMTLCLAEAEEANP